jgi:hypothetical protein
VRNGRDDVPPSCEDCYVVRVESATARIAMGFYEVPDGVRPLLRLVDQSFERAFAWRYTSRVLEDVMELPRERPLKRR